MIIAAGNPPPDAVPPKAGSCHRGGRRRRRKCRQARRQHRGELGREGWIDRRLVLRNLRGRGLDDGQVARAVMDDYVFLADPGHAAWSGGIRDLNPFPRFGLSERFAYFSLGQDPTIG